uniref:T-cell receptor alpha/delta variable 17.0 n=1 Tax=Electrophorus electricus TaxID=8005 RepID=A0AAY5EKT3_ELEEL
SCSLTVRILISFKEDQTVTLSCNYSFTGSVDNLQWYRQYSNSEPQPEFLLYILPSGTKSEPLPPRLSASVDKNLKQVDLLISSAAVSDSALYYCTLVPTVTGNPTPLYKNLPHKESFTLCHGVRSCILHMLGSSRQLPEPPLNSLLQNQLWQIQLFTTVLLE